MERIKQEKIYKSLIKDMTDKGLVTVAVNSFGNVDNQKDRSLPGSFDKTIKENFNNIFWYKNHDSNEEPGIIQKLYTDSQYLIADLKFNLDKEFSRNLYSDYRFKQENQRSIFHSIGVSALQHKDNKGIRDVSEWKLWEVSSLTKWAANENTPTLSIKSLEDFNEETELKELEIYFNWISDKGLHTDEFIKSIEKIFIGLRKEAPIVEKPAKIAAKTLDYNYLINNLKI